jgi:hypothetical protein
MWGLWWTKRHWGRFFPSTSVYPANHSTDFSIIITTRGWHNRPLSGRSVEWTLIPPPTMQIKKKLWTFMWPMHILYYVLVYWPVTVAELSETWTVFARLDAVIVGSNPTEAWMFVYVYSVFVLGSGLAIGWSLIQGVLPTVLDEETEVKRCFTDALCSNKNGSNRNKILVHCAIDAWCNNFVAFNLNFM